ETLFKEALDGLTAKLGADHPCTLTSKTNLATLYEDQGKYDRAEMLVKEVLDAETAKLGADHSDTLFSKSNLAVLFKDQGKYDDAEPLLLAGYEGMKQREAKIPPIKSVRLTEALERLVQLYDAWEKKDQADEWRKKLEAAKSAETKKP